MYERNGVETLVDNDEILWLNENIYKKDWLNLREITIKYCSDHRYELIYEPKNNPT